MNQSTVPFPTELRKPERPDDVDPPSVVSPAIERALLLSAKQLAHLLGVSVRTLWRMDAAGQIPLAGQLGCMKRWDSREIDRWLDARRRDGTYPNRRDWELMEATRRNGRSSLA